MKQAMALAIAVLCFVVPATTSVLAEEPVPEFSCPEGTVMQGTVAPGQRAWCEKDGKRHGKSVGWHKNGNKHFESTYVDGLQEGPAKEWEEDGALYKEMVYHKGKMHGAWMEWYGNGKKKWEEHHVHGKRDGRVCAWHPSGAKWKEFEYCCGKRCGTSINWNEDGTEKSRDELRSREEACRPTPPVKKKAEPKRGE